MARLQLFLLGGFSVSLDDQPVMGFESDKVRALLAYLAIEGDRPLRREMLAALLWPELSEHRARHNLRQALFNLRNTIGDQHYNSPHLTITPQTIAINQSNNTWSDATAFNQAHTANLEHQHGQLTYGDPCLERLEEAVKLYQGRFLNGFSLKDCQEFNEWTMFEAQRLHNQAVGMLTKLVMIHQERGNTDQMVAYASQWVALEPYDEAGHRAQMLALALTGQWAAALRQYRYCEKILRTELDIAPSTQTIILHEQIRTESLPASEPDIALPLPQPRPRHNLPQPLTSFIGRQREIDEITQLVKDHRLVTLTGAGGIGKTQLCLQVGRKSLDVFPDGVWFIELAPISDPQLVSQTVAFALGLCESSNRPIMDHLTEYLQDKQCLLILDNCEHLVNAVAQLAVTVLQTCPEVKILTSSRETLGVPGERSYMVPSLSFPSVEQAISIEEWQHYDALSLFVGRASAILARFCVTADNLASLVHICQRLDGVPLALELAAARVNMLSLAQIANRLDDCFNLLTEGSRTSPERQQTLRASIEWSWGLLSAEEQDLMQRLSVFTGGMNLEAVEAICGGDRIEPGEVLDLLTHLVNKSMLIVQRNQGQETRYRMLETIRQYAAVKLVESGERNQIRDRHLDYFRQLGEQAEDALVGPDQISWFKGLDRDLDNLRAALIWACETNIEAGLRLSSGLYKFWSHKHLREGDVWLSKLLAQADMVEPGIKAKALWMQGTFNFSMINFSLAHSLVEESLALYQEIGDQSGIGRCLLSLGYWGNSGYEAGKSLLLESLTIFRALGDKLRVAEVLLALGDYEGSHSNYSQAMAYLDESKILFHELGHLIGIAEVLSFIGGLGIQQGDYEYARPILVESLAIYESLELRGVIRILTNLGILYFRLGDYPQARSYWERSLFISQQIRDNPQGYWALAFLGFVCLQMGEISQAQKIFGKSLRQFSDVDSKIGIVFSTEGFASLAVTQGQTQKAACLFGWADAIRQGFQSIRPPVEQADVDKDIATIIAMIGDEAHAAAYAKGQSMTMEQAIALAVGDVKE